MGLFNTIKNTLKCFAGNQIEENIQKVSWRLVRSAQDKMGDEKGAEKRVWAIAELKKRFDGLGDDAAESYIRSAYVHFKNETRVS